ncbi:hypothetical protein, partial [Escherichia coli]|uniref:hypothetical protein n=1 Tax=Escherichia coli TaxID=562 RepID=UPI0029169A52
MIPIHKKIKAVNLFREHPNWNLKTLQKFVGPSLVRKDEIHRWKKDVMKGGTKFDKLKEIENWTWKRFQDARINKQPVS